MKATDFDNTMVKATCLIEDAEIIKNYQSSILNLQRIAPSYQLKEDECNTISEIVEKLTYLINARINSVKGTLAAAELGE